NPNGILDGAVALRVVGNHLYILCHAGLVVVNIDNPKCPKVESVLGAPFLVNPRAIDVQFRYAFIFDCEGLKIVDITHLDQPTLATAVHLNDARDVKVMRTYAYVAAGADGLAIIDVETPPAPGIPEFVTGDGCINDASAITVGATLASLYCYVGDGHNGLR